MSTGLTYERPSDVRYLPEPFGRLPGGLGRVGDLIRMARPYSGLWFITVPALTIAVWLHGGDLPIRDLVLLIASFYMVDAGATILNEICDRDSDALSAEAHRHTRHAAAGTIPLRVAYAASVTLSVAGVAAGVVLEPWFGAVAAFGVLWGLFYSVRPIHAVGKPIVSQLYWVILWPGFYAAGYGALGGDFDRGLVWVGATVLFMAIAETLAKDLRDLENDGASDKRTTPVAYGPRVTSAVSFAAFLLGSAAYVAAGVVARPDDLRLALALLVVLTLWCGRAYILTRALRERYAKETARDLHMGSLRVFLTVNLIFVASLT